MATVMATDIYEISDSIFAVRLDNAFNIVTTVTASGDDVFTWINDTLRFHSRRLQRLVVGIDVEWRPSFSRFQNPIALLQLCVGHRCLIFQLLHRDYIPENLAEFLADERFTFVGVGIAGDVERLADDCDLNVSHAVDLRELAEQATGRYDMRQMGLAALALEVIGAAVHKPRRVTLSNWDRYELNLDQIKYACVDAFVSFEIGRRLCSGEF